MQECIIEMIEKHLANFCTRGLIFAGGGPLIYGIIMLILYLCGFDKLSDGLMIFKGIITTFILVFIVAGS